jgi:archaemetzincin
MIRLSRIIVVIHIVMLSSCNTEFEPRYPIPKDAAIAYNKIQDSLVILHSELAPPQDGDWLIDHPETGQTFKEYIHGSPLGQTEKRNKLYLAILSEMDSNQLSIALKAQEYLSIFYSCETELIRLEVDYEKIPEKYYRFNEKEEIQVLTDFFLKKLLVDNLPKDAFAMIGCTTYDIFPDPQWNFVFGQASLNNRVGVWSMRRLGNPTEYPDMADKAILRNLKIASHETGHMLSMKHCIYYDCIMNGSAHIYETDNKPVYLCPVCIGKMNYNRHFALQERFKKLETFWTENELSIYHQYYNIVKEIQL